MLRTPIPKKINSKKSSSVQIMNLVWPWIAVLCIIRIFVPLRKLS